jgi:hypothetical protein
MAGEVGCAPLKLHYGICLATEGTKRTPQSEYLNNVRY